MKAFNSVGNALMVDPQFAGGPPTMFICGNDAAAKTEVTSLLDQFGWAVEDLGTVHAARAIEPLCELWCIPGMTGKGSSHAFKLLRGSPLLLARDRYRNEGHRGRRPMFRQRRHQLT